MLNRAKIICSSQKLFLEEIKNFKNVFSLNGYPGWFFDKIVTRFHNKTNNDNDETNSQTDHEIMDKRCYFVLPYLGLSSQKFVRKLFQIIKKRVDIDLVPVYKTFKIGYYFQLKTETPLPLMSNIVYQFNCSCDMSKIYIGMSSRHLTTRAKEHFDVKISSGVARVLCALGQEIFLRPLSTNIQSLK